MRSRARRQYPLPTLPIGLLLVVGWGALWAETGLGQSGRPTTSGRRTTVLHVIGKRIEDPNQPRNLLTPTEVEKREQERIIPRDVVSLYDGGVMQRIESFSPDPTPARIVVLLDNSSTLRTDLRKLASVPAAFAPEIYEGDQVMVIGVGALLPLVSGDETSSEVIASPSALAPRRSP